MRKRGDTLDIVAITGQSVPQGGGSGVLTQLRRPRIGPDGSVVFLGAGGGFVNFFVARPDGGLAPLLRRFSGALPYLQLIARANGVRDPFDARVVEAYWLGNELLDRVEVRQLYDALLERFGKQLQGRTRELVLGKAPAGARPHHSFHVLDVHSRVGELDNSLALMENCRVSWGWVVCLEGAEAIVERQPLVLQDGKLMLGPARRDRMVRQVDGRGFADEAQPGDWVTLHWGWVCETINERQRRNLERYSLHHLGLANQTL
jgi:hypothetical protein